MTTNPETWYEYDNPSMRPRNLIALMLPDDCLCTYLRSIDSFRVTQSHPLQHEHETFSILPRKWISHGGSLFLLPVSLYWCLAMSADLFSMFYHAGFLYSLGFTSYTDDLEG